MNGQGQLDLTDEQKDAVLAIYESLKIKHGLTDIIPLDLQQDLYSEAVREVLNPTPPIGQERESQ